MSVYILPHETARMTVTFLFFRNFLIKSCLLDNAGKAKYNEITKSFFNK